jgi:hypothetical protein
MAPRPLPVCLELSGFICASAHFTELEVAAGLDIAADWRQPQLGPTKRKGKKKEVFDKSSGLQAEGKGAGSLTTALSQGPAGAASGVGRCPPDLFECRPNLHFLTPGHPTSATRHHGSIWSQCDHPNVSPAAPSTQNYLTTAHVKQSCKFCQHFSKDRAQGTG